MWPKKGLLLRFRMGLEITVIKRYSTISRAPVQEPHYQMQCHTEHSFGELTSLHGIQSAYSTPQRYGDLFVPGAVTSRVITNLLIFIDFHRSYFDRYMNSLINLSILPSRLGQSNTPTTSLKSGKTLDMTLNNLMVRFQ